MTLDTAEELNSLLVEHNRRMAELFPRLRRELAADDFKEYADPLGHMLALSFDVLDKVWVAYPALKPDDAKA